MKAANPVLALASAALLAAVAAPAAGGETHADERQRNRTAVEQAFREDLKRHAANPDMLVLRGLTANRKEKWVRLKAEATGIGGTEPVEFFLIGPGSGHDYEAIARSFAEPSAVHTALQFIGMAPGRPVEPDALRFHPKGERVKMTFARQTGAPIRAERLIFNSRAGGPLAETGLVFTGSRLTVPDKGGKSEYAADVEDPNSVASNYNEPVSVLDVPRLAPQGDVYRLQSADAQCLFRKGEMLDVELRPEYADGRKRVADVCMAVAPAEGRAGTNLSQVAVSLEFAGGRRVAGGLPDALKEFGLLAEGGRDPFVTLRFDPGLPLRTIKDLCTVLASIETERGIRLEPPLEGHLYYRAFLPNEDNRDRAKRMAQPWELQLRLSGDKVAGTLTQIEQVLRDDRALPDLKLAHFDVPTPRDLRGELDARGPGLRVILVFAPPLLRHGQLMDFIKPALPTHPTVYVFLDEAQAQPAVTPGRTSSADPGTK
jgi:hypothetical protein